MAKRSGILGIVLAGDVLRFVAPAYCVPLASLALSGVTGIEVLGEVWYWLFLPAGGFHALMALSVASSIDEVPASEPDAEGRERRLRREFAVLKSVEGLRAIKDLAEEYSQLQPVLARRKETDPTAVAHIPALASETFRQGLSVLEDVLELTRALDVNDREQLEASIAMLEKEIRSLQGDPAQVERVRIREERLASQKERLEIIRHELLLIDQLLSQSDRCSGSLQRVRLELAAMRADTSADSVVAVTDTLRKTIDNARGVQAELKRIGAQDSP